MLLEWYLHESSTWRTSFLGDRLRWLVCFIKLVCASRSPLCAKSYDWPLRPYILWRLFNMLCHSCTDGRKKWKKDYPNDCLSYADHHVLNYDLFLGHIRVSCSYVHSWIYNSYEEYRRDFSLIRISTRERISRKWYCIFLGRLRLHLLPSNPSFPHKWYQSISLLGFYTFSMVKLDVLYTLLSWVFALLSRQRQSWAISPAWGKPYIPLQSLT